MRVTRPLPRCLVRSFTEYLLALVLCTPLVQACGDASPGGGGEEVDAGAGGDQNSSGAPGNAATAEAGTAGAPHQSGSSTVGGSGAGGSHETVGPSGGGGSSGAGGSSSVGATTAGTSGAPTTESEGSGLPRSLLLHDLDTEQLTTLCDWMAESVGGYGAEFDCGNGTTLSAATSRETCVEDTVVPATCTATVADAEDCMLTACGSMTGCWAMAACAS